MKMHPPNALVWAEHSLLNLQRLFAERLVDWREVARYRKALAEDAELLFSNHGHSMQEIDCGVKAWELAAVLVFLEGNENALETLQQQVATVRIAVSKAVKQYYPA